MVPKKKPPKQPSATSDKKRKTEIAEDRILVQNWFGRLVGMWKIFVKLYHWSEEKYEDLFTVCAFLNNIHISYYPLRDDGDDRLSNAMKKLHAIGVTASKRQQAPQKQYKENHKKKLWSYQELGTQSNQTNNETNLKNVFANPLGGLLGCLGVAASEGGFETKSASSSSTLSSLHILRLDLQWW